MTEKHSSVSKQFEDITNKMDKLKNALGRFIAEWILALPIGINYDSWKYLHQVIGDWE